MPQTPDIWNGKLDLPTIAGDVTVPLMVDQLSAEVCVVGAGPVGGTLACRLAAAGVATIVVDRAALPSMEHPAFDWSVSAAFVDRSFVTGRLRLPPDRAASCRSQGCGTG